MNREPYFHLTTPGYFSEGKVLIAGVLVMVAIFVTDIFSGADIRLHVLYVFPLASIALNCKQISRPLFGLALSLAFQLFTFVENGIRHSPLVADALVTFSASLLIIVLARATRENYLHTQNLAATDSLTGLHNRRSFQSIADLEVGRQKRYGGVFSMAMIDLDNFKVLNDSQGHHAGDEALRLVSEALRHHIRESDSAARLGGDEFAILMPNAQEADCRHLCDQLGARISATLAAAGYAVTASIGCTTFDRAPDSVAEAFQRADRAMYAAKAAGKGRTAVF